MDGKSMQILLESNFFAVNGSKYKHWNCLLNLPLGEGTLKCIALSWKILDGKFYFCSSHKYAIDDPWKHCKLHVFYLYYNTMLNITLLWSSERISTVSLKFMVLEWQSIICRYRYGHFSKILHYLLLYLQV